MGDAGIDAGKGSDIRGRVCLVTGATSGIGRETARGLARLGATVVLAGRNPERGAATREGIVLDTGNPNVDFMLVDLSSQASLRAFARDFKAKYPRLHVLVNNAGFYTNRRTLTVDGIESTFAVNHLGYFLLTNLLLDLLRTSAPSRIVNVSSEAQRSGRIHFEDLNGERKFSGFRAYSQSKVANVLFTYELARMLEGTGVTANCLHPGVVRSNFGKGGGAFMAFMVRLLSPFMISPREGAGTSIYLASSPDVEGVSGKYFIKKRPADSSGLSHDEGVRRRLWDVSAELTGLDRPSAGA